MSKPIETIILIKITNLRQTEIEAKTVTKQRKFKEEVTQVPTSIKRKDYK